ncbi:mitochondrial import inner membrane translocase subunit Tim21 isoform X2 [Thalassophryne amazonica]|nr:mitochondrial import inner membrane translocase subunit Tim21 isoform X2 [Thalassophryne amazonica]XP_034026353.1 mitochondrial import inner membrane translocase subunit Tim21 isoform X2 [Thalassophryne amazonica]
MVICAVQGCSNGKYKLDKWKLNACDVHPGTKKGCGSCICPPPFVLYPFPTERKDPNARKHWIRLINRKDIKTGKNWMPRHFSRVCSVHFPDGSPTDTHPYPTLNLGYVTRGRGGKPRKPLAERHMLQVKKTEPEEPIKIKVEDTFDSVPVDDHKVPENASEHNWHNYCIHDKGCEGCNKLAKELKCAVQEFETLTDQLEIQSKNKNVRNTTVINKFIRTDKKVRQNTGLPNQSTLDSLYSHLEPRLKEMRYWGGVKKVTSTKIFRRCKKSSNKREPQRKLNGKSEFVLVLMKLRLGLSNIFLSDLFNISVSTCSKIFNTWIRFLAKELKPLIYWPSGDIIRKLLPPSLASKYSSLRCTLDCMEVFIERPNHLELQAMTWSDCKKHSTVKYLIAIAPNGMITFLSEGYGGGGSDKDIVIASGFLDLLDPGDEILADRGFIINGELLMHHAKLHILPPSLSIDQQTTADVAKTRKIANARIHVKRAIGRMKWFAILRNTVPITFVPLLNDTVLVCAALCNLLPPLVC